MSCPSCLTNLFLLTQKFCIPTWKGHYVTGPDIVCFSNIACVENSLTKLTQNCCRLFKSFNPCNNVNCCPKNCIINK